MLKDFGLGSQILENVDNRITLGFKLDCQNQNGITNLKPQSQIMNWQQGQFVRN